MPGALKAFAQITKHAGIRGFLGNYKLGFALSAEPFLPAFHRTVARCDCHGAKHNTGVTAFTRFGTHAKGKIHAPVFPAANKANRFGLPHFRANANAPAAENAFFMSKRIADLFNPAPHRDILNGTGVRRLGNEKLGDITPEFSDLFCVTTNHHSLFNI